MDVVSSGGSTSEIDSWVPVSSSGSSTQEVDSLGTSFKCLELQVAELRVPGFSFLEGPPVLPHIMRYLLFLYTFAMLPSCCKVVVPFLHFLRFSMGNL